MNNINLMLGILAIVMMGSGIANLFYIINKHLKPIDITVKKERKNGKRYME